LLNRLPSHVKDLDWTEIPIDGTRHHKWRTIAGAVRDLNDFCGEYDYQADLEDWLSRYADKHSQPNVRR